MCGIFGALTEKGLSAGLVTQIKESLRHRGPDDEGHKSIIPTISSVLDMIHLRLSIIDLSKEASQPMSYSNGVLWIVYNGEIFNYKELREELKLKGYDFVTQSDTEVILASYEEWGESCVERFNGDWAFCIYDKRNNSLFLSRDRLGVKPLYYYRDEENFIFSSEIRALFKTPYVKTSWDLNMVSTLVLLGVSDFSESTMFEGIRQLAPATNMVIDIGYGEVRFSRYWVPPFGEEAGKYSKEQEKRYSRDIRDLLEDAVRLRLRADVPVGTCLSGGIDSSAVVALINGMVKGNSLEAKSVGEMQKTFTAEYPGERIDEGKWARLMNDFSGADGKFVEPGAEDLKSELDDFITTHGELCRSTSMYAQYKVMQLASKNVKVVLDGQGADELFGGYAHYKEYFKRFGLSIAPRKLLSLKYQSLKGILEKVLKGKVNIDFVLDILKRKYPPDLNTALYMDETKYNLQQLLRYEDRNSMRFGVEARVPFTDHRLVEYVLQIPACYKVRDGWTKYILRKAMEGLLPDEVVWRKDKIGFETPEEKWLPEVNEFKHFLSKFGLSSYNGDYFWWRAFNFTKLGDMR